MTQSQRRAARAALFLVLAALIGCGTSNSKPKSVPVSGTVTIDGKPLPEGTVYFKTIQTGAFDSLPVKDGKFEGGADVGERRVEVNSYRIKIVKGEMGGEVKENVLPARYNTNSTLSATVTAVGPNTFTFDVKSK